MQLKKIFGTFRSGLSGSLVRFALIPSLLFVLGSAALAQETDDSDKYSPDLNAAPPPIRIMSKGEREQLDAEQDIKDRTKLALDLMSARLTKAQTLNEQGAFKEMYGELGGFHALMDDTLDFLFNNPRNKGSVLANFKRFEMTLRTFAPRLGLIRRELPLQYDPYVRSLIRYVRDARSKAVEPLFGETVVPNRRET